MDNVFDLYVVNRDQPFRTAMLTLPASIYEMMDIAEQVGSEKVEELCFEFEESYRGEYLVNALGRDITIPKLNILAWKVAEMDEEQEAILEGLIKMEQKKQDVPWLPYLFSVPRGYTDGFYSWCRQIAGLCLTAFLQTTILIAGLMVWNSNMLLGCGLMLSATEIPRVAQQFGMYTSTRANVMSAVYATQTVVGLTRNLAAAIK